MTGAVVKFPVGRVVREHRIGCILAATPEAEEVERALRSVRDAITTLLLFYLIPTIVAVIRGHRSVWAIGFVNVVLGWSVIGWLGAMIWALSGRHVSPCRSGKAYRLKDGYIENPFRSEPPKVLGRREEQ
jgi:hypothetical protein